MLTQEQALEIYRSTGAILKGHFKLTSGRHSDTYMQSAKLFVQPAQAEKVCAALAEKLTAAGIKADMVISPAIGGILMGYEVARQLGLPNVFAERENGEMTLRRGFAVEKGAKLIVTEDVVTTGGSVKEVIALVRSLAGQLAPYGVTVNNVAPGVINTDRNLAALNDEVYARHVVSMIPMGFYGEKEDCAGIVRLLCSEEGRYITGQSIYVDGGKSL